MNIGKILNNLRDSVIEEYELEYEEKYENFLEQFLTPHELEKISIKQILVVLDHRPHSLISISYALRFAKVFGAQLFVLTTDHHAELIENESQPLDSVKLYVLKDIGLPQVNEIIDFNSIDLVIINFTHKLRERLQNTLHLPILITKASQFMKK